MIAPGSGKSFTPNIQGLGDNSTCMPNILPISSVVYGSVPVHGVTQLGFRSHPTGSSTPEAITTTFSFLRSDKPYTPPRRSDTLVLAKLLRQLQDLSFLTSGDPIRPFQVVFMIFTCASTQGWGAHMGDCQTLSIWTHSNCKLHINTLELNAVILALHQWVSVLQGHQVMIATDNTTVVSYIHKQGGTDSYILLRLVVDLFIWLQTQDIATRASHIPGCLHVIVDCLSRLNQPITTEWSFHPKIVNRIFGT